MVLELILEKYDVMKWQTQAINITTNLMVKIDLNLPELSVTKIVTWNCHLGDSTKGKYDIVLGKYITTVLVFNLKISDHVIEAYYGPFKGSTATMVDLGTYEFKYLNTDKIIPEGLFMNAYIE